MLVIWKPGIVGLTLWHLVDFFSVVWHAAKSLVRAASVKSSSVSHNWVWSWLHHWRWLSRGHEPWIAWHFIELYIFWLHHWGVVWIRWCHRFPYHWISSRTRRNGINNIHWLLLWFEWRCYRLGVLDRRIIYDIWRINVAWRWIRVALILG